MKITRVLGKKVLIKLLEEEKTTGGLIVMANDQEAGLSKGIVMNYGNEVSEFALDKGVTTVLFEKWGSPSVDLGEGSKDKYFIVDEDKIVAVYE